MSVFTSRLEKKYLVIFLLKTKKFKSISSQCTASNFLKDKQKSPIVIVLEVTRKHYLFNLQLFGGVAQNMTFLRTLQKTFDSKATFWPGTLLWQKAIYIKKIPWPAVKYSAGLLIKDTIILFHANSFKTQWWCFLLKIMEIGNTSLVAREVCPLSVLGSPVHIL